MTALLSCHCVIVIVVCNYDCAAFYEASGASTCSLGFFHPRRNQCAPISKIVANNIISRFSAMAIGWENIVLPQMLEEEDV